MSGVLEGIKVLEMGHVIAAPAAAAMMADWGAEVIKVEPPTGDMARGIRLPVTPEEIAQSKKYADIGWYYQMMNRGKKSVSINLKTEAAKDILKRLTLWADIFLTNYELKTLDQLGADYDSLCKINPKIVYALLTGYGTVGPDKDERGFDFAAAWARSGLMYMMAEPEGVPPPQRGGMMDRTVGSNMVAGTLAALLHRNKTGQGQKLEFSLYHTGVWTDAEDIQPALMGWPVFRHDRANARNPIWNNYRTKDNGWFWLANLQPDLSWGDFCRSIGMPELEKDVLYCSIEARRNNCHELIRIIDRVLATKNRAEWETIFRKHNVIYGRVQSPAEVVNDPQALANDFFVDLKHPVATDAKTIMSPVKFIQNPSEVKSAGPEIGQHNEEVLLQMGYSWEDVVALKEKGAIL